MPQTPSKSSFKDGIPTADEEALQSPAVDPISGVGLAAGFGPVAAGKILFQQILLHSLLGNSPTSQALGTPLPLLNRENVQESLKMAGKAAKSETPGVPNNFRYLVGQTMRDIGLRDAMENYVRFNPNVKVGNDVLSESALSNIFSKVLKYFPETMRQAEKIPIEIE